MRCRYDPKWESKYDPSTPSPLIYIYMGMGQNPGTIREPQNSWDLWMFIPLKMYL